MMKMMFSIVVFAALTSASVSAEPWFDAGVGTTETWPANNVEYVVEDVGLWRNTSFAERIGENDQRRLAVSAPKENCLMFVLSEPKVAGEEFITVTTKVRLAVADPEEPLPAAAPLCALTPVQVGTDETAYFGLALDEAGGTNSWVRLAGATPTEGATVTLSFSTKEGADGVKLVRYAVNGQVLTLNDREWLPMEAGDEDDPMSIVSVRYSGSGEVGSLTGVVGGDSPGELTVVEPGSPAEVAAADADAATKAVVLKVVVPTDEEGTAVVEESVYKGYFKLVAEPVPDETGLYSVSAVLDESLVRPAIEKTVAIDVPFTVDEETSAVTVAAKQGLYYSLLRGATLDAIEDVVDTQLATGETVVLTDDAKLPTAAFYRVAVSFSH